MLGFKSTQLWTSKFLNVLATGIVAAVIIGSAISSQTLLWRYTIEHTGQERLESLDRAAYHINSRLRARANDLFFIRQVAQDELERNPHASLTNENLLSAIRSMMIARGQYDQVSILGLKGDEVLRYRWSGESAPWKENTEKVIQGPSGNPYLREILTAPADAVIYSQVDLEQEGAKIVQPYKPVLRLWGQIVGSDGQPRAILELSYLAKQLFQDLRKATDQHYNTFLLNDKGYWLIGPDPSKEWAFMFPNLKGNNLPEQNSALWKKITSSKSGWFTENGTFYCFYNVDPGNGEVEYPALHTTIRGWDRLHLTILEQEPEGRLWHSLRQILLIIWLSCAASVAFFCPLTWLIVLHRQRRRMASLELHRSQLLLLDALEKEKEATRRAQEAEKGKSEFLANMSHEIRTPMNAVIGLSHLALEMNLSAKSRDYLKKIHDSSKALLNILNDILDYSKLEAGCLDLECTEFSLEEVLQNVANLFVLHAEEKSVEVVLDLDPAVPLTVMGDALRLSQVLNNLVGNAVKFTHQGQVVFRVKEVLRESEHTTLQFAIIDTGIGMSPDQVQRLFRAFGQADSSINRRYGGTGLGLTISKQLVEKMGSEIEVQSQLGQGSQFKFAIRFKLPTIPLILGPSVPLRKMRVLLVDDLSSARESLSHVLCFWGLEVVATASGKEALEEVARSIHSGEKFDLLVVDWKMPEMDGLELVSRARHLWRQSGLDQFMAIMMVMGHTRDLSMEDWADPVLDLTLNKPVMISELLQAILQVQGGFPPLTKSATTVSSMPLAILGARILLVEDSPINQQVAKEMLERDGFQVTVACDGEQGLRIARATQFDLVFMDLHMPGMDGFETTRRLRQQPSYDQTPIIAMTAAVLDKDRAACEAAGMNDHLAKPISHQELRRVLVKWIQSIGSTGDSFEGKEPSFERSPGPSELTGFDLPGAMERMNLTSASLIESLKEARKSFSDDADELFKSIAAGKREAAIHLAHRIKGGAATLGAVALAEEAERLEMELKENESNLSTKIFEQELKNTLHVVSSL